MIDKFFNFKNYVITVVSFILLTFSFPGLLMLSYPYLFSFADEKLISTVGFYLVATWVLTICLFSYRRESDYWFEERADRLFFKSLYLLNFLSLVLILPLLGFFRAQIEGSPKNLLVNLLVLFIPTLLVGGLRDDFLVDKILSRRRGIVNYNKLEKDKLEIFLKEKGIKFVGREIVTIPCMCFRCMPNGVDIKYSSKYNYKITFLKDIGKYLSLSFLFFLFVILLHTNLMGDFFRAGIVIFIFTLIFPLNFKVGLFLARKRFKSVDQIENIAIREFVDELAEKNNVKILGVMPISGIFGNSEREKAVKNGFDTESNACYLPVGKRRGYMFLGHAYSNLDNLSKGVIAHEIGHGDFNSVNDVIRVKVLFTFFKVFIPLLVLNSTNSFFFSFLTCVFLCFLLIGLEKRRSRWLELRADLFSLKAVSNPYLIEFFELIIKLRGDSRTPKIIKNIFKLYSTHPEEEKRIENINRVGNIKNSKY